MKTKILGCLFLLVVFGCTFSKKNNSTNREAEYVTVRSHMHSRTTNELTQLLYGYISKSNDTIGTGNKRWLMSIIRLSNDTDFDFVKLCVNGYFGINPSLGLSPFKSWEKDKKDHPSYTMGVVFDNTNKEGVSTKFMHFIYSETGDLKTLTIATDL